MKKHFGVDAAALLLEKQWEGVESLKDKDVFTKVNIVYIKGVNDDHIHEVVKRRKALAQASPTSCR